MITFCDRIERMSPSQASAILAESYLHRNCPIDTPAGRDTVISQLTRLKTCSLERAEKIYAHALARRAPDGAGYLNQECGRPACN